VQTRRRRRLLLATRYSLLATTFASANLGAQNTASCDCDTVTLAPYVVTAAQTKQPLIVETDPRAPAQPVPAHDGADILKNVAGFSVIRKGGTDGDPVLRGMAGSRLGILIDGDAIYGGCGNRMDPPTAYAFPMTYDRVTIIKGPQTVLHGPGNSAGVVLFERDFKRLATPAADIMASMTGASFGRFDGLADVRAGNTLLQARATATYTRADDYEDGDGNSVHSSYERWSANASLLWTPGAQTYVELAAARSDGKAAYADRAMDGVKFDRTNCALRLRRDNITPVITSVEARAYYNYVDHVMDNFTLRDFKPTMSMANPSANNPDRQTIGGLAQITLTPGSAEFPLGTDEGAKKNLGAPRDASTLTITAGVDTQGNKHTLRATTNETAMPYEAMSRTRDARFSQYGIFAEAMWTPAPANRLIAGARLDNWQATDYRQARTIAMVATPNPTANQTRRANLTSGFIRYEHDLTCCGHHGSDCTCKTPLTLFAGAGVVQRFPDYWELFPNESATTITAFNTTKPETTAQADLGALWHSGPVDVSVSLFASRITDYILIQSGYAKPTGTMGGTRAATIVRNIDARTFGFESTLTWHITEHWKADATAAYVLGENDTDSLPLAQIPPIDARVALAYATSDWSVGGLLRAVSVQKRVAVGQGNIAGQDIGPSAGFATAALNASYRFGKYVRLSAGVDNLFDKTYAEHISRAGSIIPGFVQMRQINEPGRTLWAKLDVTF